MALPAPGHVAGFVTDEVQAARVGEAGVVGRGVEFNGFLVLAGNDFD